MSLLPLPEDRQVSPPLRSLVSLAPTDRSLVVTGGPGTGKTLFALSHCLKSAQEYSESQFLLIVSSELLANSLEAAVRPTGVDNLQVFTWRGWLTYEYGHRGQGRVPRKRGERIFDWSAMNLDWGGWFSAPASRYRMIAIDEAQDVPLKVLKQARDASLALKLFCDPYQRFELNGSELEQMVEILGVSNPWPVYVLEEDFRTTKEIQAFAHAVFAPDRSIPIHRPAARSGALPRVLLTSDEEALKSIVTEVNRLGAQPGIESLAVLTTHANRGRIQGELARAGLDTGVGFSPSDDAASIRVLPVEAVRGLEFDAVLLAIISTAAEEAAALGTWLDMYVGATRAREMLSIVIDRNAVTAEIHEALEESADLWTPSNGKA
ncbi:MAG: hypothetical protein WD273_05485 [Trueperaceae bacterium]